MTQSLTGSWTKEITAGYAPPASEETGIRYPRALTSLEHDTGIAGKTPKMEVKIARRILG